MKMTIKIIMILSLFFYSMWLINDTRLFLGIFIFAWADSISKSLK